MNGDPLHQLKDIEDLHSSPKTFKIKEFELVFVAFSFSEDRIGQLMIALKT